MGGDRKIGSAGFTATPTGVHVFKPRGDILRVGGCKVLNRKASRPNPTRRRVKETVRRQQPQPLRRDQALHEVAQVMRGRAQQTQALNVLLARILELRKSVKLRLPQLEWRKDHPEKGSARPRSSRTCSTETTDA